MNTNTLPDTIAAMYSGPAVYAALTAGFTGTDTEITAHIGNGHIKSRVRAALQALKSVGLVDGVKVDPNNNFSALIWSAVAPAADDAADIAAMDADIAAGAEIDSAVESTGHLPGNDDRDAAFAEALADVMGDDSDADGADNDTPPADVPADAPKPRTARSGRVRLLAVYPNDPAPSDGTRGPGKAMDRLTAWFEANPGTHRIADIAKGLDTKWTADVLKTVRRVMAVDPRVTQVDGARFATFTFTPAEDVAADAE